jgi:hypothetical protein
MSITIVNYEARLGLRVPGSMLQELVRNAGSLQILNSEPGILNPKTSIFGFWTAEEFGAHMRAFWGNLPEKDNILPEKRL